MTERKQKWYSFEPTEGLTTYELVMIKKQIHHNLHGRPLAENCFMVGRLDSDLLKGLSGQLMRHFKKV